MYIYFKSLYLYATKSETIILMRLYSTTFKTKYGHALINKFGNKMYYINCHLDNIMVICNICTNKFKDCPFLLLLLLLIIIIEKIPVTSVSLSW